jgi:hypothetical protein
MPSGGRDADPSTIFPPLFFPSFAHFFRDFVAHNPHFARIERGFFNRLKATVATVRFVAAFIKKP